MKLSANKAYKVGSIPGILKITLKSESVGFPLYIKIFDKFPYTQSDSFVLFYVPW